MTYKIIIQTPNQKIQISNNSDNKAGLKSTKQYKGKKQNGSAQDIYYFGTVEVLQTKPQN